MNLRGKKSKSINVEIILLVVFNLILIYSVLATTITPSNGSVRGTATVTVVSPGSGSVPRGYTLEWSDEFNGTTLDTTKWFTGGPTCTPWNNNIPANVALDGNGHIVFTATKDSIGTHYGGNIASRCDNTNTDNFIFKYGYVEIRAKFADTNQIDGIGTNLWLSSSTRWPPEIDITESGSGPMDVTNADGVSTAVNALKMTRHCNVADGPLCDGIVEYLYSIFKYAIFNKVDMTKESGNVFIHDAYGNSVNLAKDFHLYSLEWTPTYISWKLDGVEIFRVTTGIPTDTMYPILGVSAGTWGAGPVKSNTPFPTNVYVDYIRIYQKSDTIII
jgi:beta-glucanase (GH16 family)